jgi:predicted PurR-regulated permease PerM
MDFLRNLFGNLTSGIIRLLVAVGIIAAVGYFIVRPALDTANNYNQTLQRSFGPNGIGDLKDINKTIDNVNRQVQREIRKSFKAAKTEGNPNRLIKCIQHAHGDVQKIQRCTVKF